MKQEQLKEFVIKWKNVRLDMTPREQNMMNMRYGLTDDLTHSLEEVGKMYGVTRERVRQIEAKVWDKIRLHEKESNKI